MACSVILAYHLNGLLINFQNIIKSLHLDHQNSSYRAWYQPVQFLCEGEVVGLEVSEDGSSIV